MTPKRTFEKEADVKAEVKKLLTRNDWMFWMPPASGYGRAGIADVNALKDGVFLAIETKFGSKQPTPLQVKFLRSVNARGGFGFVVNEKTVEWLAGWLAAFARAAEATAKKEPIAPEDGAYMVNAIDMMTRALR